MSQIHSFQDRLTEIKLSLANEDLNVAGRRLIDYVYDFDLDDLYKHQSLQLRRRYNEGKELGHGSVDDSELKTEFDRLLMKVTEVQISNFAELETPETVCNVVGITKSFRSRLHNFTFEPLNFEMKQGEIVGLVGENGNGKTTLLRMLAGDLAFDEGAIAYFGEEVNDWRKIKERVAFVPQRIERWFGTADDNISFRAAVRGFKGQLNEEKVEFIIHRMGLTNFRELGWSQLSSGYRLRFEIAMALVWNPEILILDEPLANLDIQAQEGLLQDLKNLSQSLKHPVTIILSSQQLHEVEVVADHIIFLKNGRVVNPDQINDGVKTFELNGELDYENLNTLFNDWKNVRIEKSASAFVISVSETYTNQQFWKKISDSGISISYFRDISKSTRKFFSDKY